MPFFAYKGRDRAGQAVQGVLEGTDSGAVAGQLFSSGITPIEIKATSAPLARAGPGLLSRFGEPGITHTDVLLFCRHMQHSNHERIVMRMPKDLGAYLLLHGRSKWTEPLSKFDLFV